MRRPRMTKWDLLGTVVSGTVEGYLLLRWLNRMWGCTEEIKRAKKRGIRV